MNKQGDSCPINKNQVNEIVIRIIAMQVVFIVGAIVYFQDPLLAVILAYDFGVRAFGLSKFSLLKIIAQKTVTHFQIGFQATNEAPKLFAAKIGCFFVGLLTTFLFLEWSLLSTIFGACILIFATLESVFGVCVGCVVYQKAARFGFVQNPS